MRSAIIIAAGYGNRMWPYAGLRQKSCLPVLGQPIIRRTVESLISVGVSEIIVVIGYRGESVRHALSGLNMVRFVTQRDISGTASAVSAGIAECNDDAIVICYGDIVTTTDNISSVIRRFENESPVACILTARTLPNCTHWYTVETDNHGVVTSLLPRTNRPFPKFAGIIAIKVSLLREYLMRNPGIFLRAPLGCMPPQESDLIFTLNEMVEAKESMLADLARDFVVDLNKPWHIAEANQRANTHFFNSITENSIASTAFIHDSIEIPSSAKLLVGEDAKIGKNCKFEGSVFVAKGARIENGPIVRRNCVICQGTVCENYCLIGECAVLGENSYFGHGTEFIGVAISRASIRHPSQICAILGENVNIAGGVMTGNWRFDDGVRTQVTLGHREKPQNFGEMTFIGDFVRIGNNVVFSPGVRVGYYTCIAPGTYVMEDVPERTLLLNKQQQEQRPWSPEIYGW